MNPVEIIKFKRQNKTLTEEQIKFFLESYLEGTVKDYQMSAFLMAVYFNGMNEEETYYLTEIMLNSGRIVDLSFINKPKVDKHSTGGVGDKTSLILAPIAASCGICVPMISGRGLGHTGGTLDKLESIPGFKVNCSIEKYKQILSEIGVALIGQTSELAPADKKIYALRDVTATVENISLITSSIMSKKLAEGAESFVFDVKIGNGANLPDYDESLALTKNLLAVSKKFGKKAIAILTDMNQPLGMKIGNWIEIEECLEVMEGKKDIPDLVEVNNLLTGAMIFISGKSVSIEEGVKIAEEKIKDGSAFKKFLEIVKTQEGDTEYIKDYKNFKRPEFNKKITSAKDGYLRELSAYNFGMASIELGCGRKKADDKINYLAGIELFRKVGDKISKGDEICELWADTNERIYDAEIIIKKGILISDSKPSHGKLIYDILYSE